MANLIQYSDFANYREISANISAAKRLDPYIVETQELDIRPLLGDIFYQKVINTQASYSTLLNGGTYTYENETYTFKGLKAVAIYYTYARFVMNQDVQATPSGMVRKLHQESEPLTEASINRVASNARQVASAYWQQCYDYLCRQTGTLFEDWAGKKSGNKQIRITAI